MAAQIVGVAPIAREFALHVCPDRAILSQPMDEHDRPAFARNRVANIDIAEPDLHWKRPSVPSAWALASACAALSTSGRRSILRILPAGVRGMVLTKRSISGAKYFGKPRSRMNCCSSERSGRR